MLEALKQLGCRIEGGRIHMAMLATIIAGFWSLMSGNVVLMAMTALCVPVG